MENQPSPIIRLENITKKFPGVVALDRINLSIMPGEVHAIVGENGAGKSTLMNLLAGELQPDEGTIFFEGIPQVITDPLVSQKLGISVVFQELALCQNLTIAENISLWQASTSSIVGLVNRKTFEQTARQYLSELGLPDIDPRLPVGQLSVAKQQLVEIAKALSTQAQVLILDEPNSALTQEESEHLFAIIRKLRERGKTILYISHHLEEVLALADRITVLRDGKLVDTLVAKDATIKDLIRLMVGREIRVEGRDFRDLSDAAVALEIEDLRSPGTVNGVSLNVRIGEIVGIAGMPDSYKDELVECLFGLRSYEGSICIHGKKGQINSPNDAIREGMYLIPADRRGSGAFLALDIQDNIIASNLKAVSQSGILRTRAKRSMANKFFSSLDIRASGLKQVMATLSGGNQQKVILARGLATEPSILVLHEPTRGIDVGAKSEIYRILQNLAAQGAAILIVSSELPELISQCDRIYVMHAGRVSGLFEHSEANEEAIMACMMGHAVHIH